MFTRILAAAALTAGLSVAAFAQDTTDPATTEDPAATWDQSAIGSFTDPATGQLLPQEEIQANWDALPEEEQAQLRAECASVTAMQDPVQDDPADDAGDITTGALENGDQMAMAELCAWVETQ